MQAGTVCRLSFDMSSPDEDLRSWPELPELFQEESKEANPGAAAAHLWDPECSMWLWMAEVSVPFWQVVLPEGAYDIGAETPFEVELSFEPK